MRRRLGGRETRGMCPVDEGIVCTMYNRWTMQDSMPCMYHIHPRRTKNSSDIRFLRGSSGVHGIRVLYDVTRRW